MKLLKTPSFASLIFLSFAVILFSGCLTGRKMDKYLALQYNNELPKPAKKKNTDITVTSNITFPGSDISNSTNKTSKMLPLLLYWQWEYRVSSTLNPAIGIIRFTNAINSSANRALNNKLQGRKLELTVEQIPASFALVDKSHLIFLVLYAINWEKVYREPETKDLVVSYKLVQTDNTVKTGKISIKNNAKINGLRFFQSWKSATREELADYDANVNKMSRDFVDRLIEEL